MQNGENLNYSNTMSDQLILGIETSGIVCGVAWWQPDNVLLEYHFEQKNAHATLLPELVEKGFKELNRNIDSTTYLTVGSGPGSFTGLRIGMAYAKGFCFGLDIPLIPVNHFEMLAFAAEDDRFPLFTLIEARNNNYYTGVFNTSKSNLDKKYLSNITQLEKELPDIGNIVVHEELERGKLAQKFDKLVQLLQIEYNAVDLCRISYQKYINENPKSLDEIEPLYLQAFAGVL